jgi:ABC-type antimicrobial peptide transport system permease subunit
LAGAFGLSRLMTGLLFGIEPSDPFTYIVVALVLTAAAIVSCFLPALRALRVDPATALREE